MGLEPSPKHLPGLQIGVSTTSLAMGSSSQALDDPRRSPTAAIRAMAVSTPEAARLVEALQGATAAVR